MPYPETEKLRAAFLAHKMASRRSFPWYAKQMGVSRRTLQEFVKNRMPLYEIGKRIEGWLQKHRSP